MLDRTTRMSSSLSPPRLSLNMSTTQLRRSFSEGSLRSMSVAKGTLALRLPQVSTNSRNWKLSVMESLQIRSPSMPTLVPTGESQGSKASLPSSGTSKNKAIIGLSSEAPPRLSLTKGSFDRPFGLHTPKQSIDMIRSAFGNPFPSPKVKVNECLEQLSSTNRPFTSHAPKHSIEGSRFAVGKHGKHRASATSVHLYNMRISHHLRSESSFSSAAVTTAAPTRSHTPQRALSRTGTVPLPTNHRCQRQTSKSNFAPGDVSQELCNVVNDTTSSVYSTAANSTVNSLPGSTLHIPRTSIADRCQHSEKDYVTLVSDEITPITNDESRGLSSEEDKVVPGNLSSSNLSHGSKSSKTSRFKEDFESSEAKRSTKRSSIVNLFHRSRGKRGTDSLGSFDGTVDDEPKRLQRAMALADRGDATGLLAKAIKEQQNEKASMYLSANKGMAPREIYRQRSSSFSKPRTPISGAGRARSESVNHPQSAPTASSRRSSSETHLKPESSMPDFTTGSDSNITMTFKKRAYSTLGRLKPEFSIPLFADSEDSDVILSIEPRTQDSVFRLDPMETTPTGSRKASLEARPSFQLNDVPAVVQSVPATPSSPHVEFRLTIPICANENEGSTSAVDREEGIDNVNLGSWSRYPSHTREKRTGSADAADLVKTRDFAYDINPVNITTDSSTEDSAKKSKKGKKKIKSRTGLPKSKSMMLGKDFIKNYARIIRSPSVEWLSHGKGHRSSISTGGSLAHPELEMLPPFFASMPFEDIEEEDVGLSNIMMHKAHKDTLSISKAHKEAIELRTLRPQKRIRRESSIVAGPSRFDGSSEARTNDAQTPRAASTPGVLFSETVATAPENVGSDAALDWSHEDAPSVKVPRNSGSINHSKISTSGDSITSSTDIPQLIDAMLASRHPSNRRISTSVSLDDVNTPHTYPGCVRPELHKKNQSLGSVASLRASSMDLLKRLAEAEEHESMRLKKLLQEENSIEDASIHHKATEIDPKSGPSPPMQLCNHDGPLALGVGPTISHVVQAD
jgi:hypothetical protein